MKIWEASTARSQHNLSQGRVRPRAMNDSREQRFPKRACCSLFTLFCNQQSLQFIINTLRLSLQDQALQSEAHLQLFVFTFILG